MDRFEDYILTRLSQGCRNAAQIYREITELGYQGGHTNVRAYVAHLRKSTADGSTPAKRAAWAQALSPRALRWLLTRDHMDLNQEEQAQLDQLLQVSPDVQVIHTLLHAFLDMVRERHHQQLRPWMEQASKSEIPELKSFVAGIERDYDAVKEALRFPSPLIPRSGLTGSPRSPRSALSGHRAVLPPIATLSVANARAAGWRIATFMTLLGNSFFLHD